MTNAPKPYDGSPKPPAPPPKRVVCQYDGCSYYPPVKGVYTCKYCGSKVPVYNEWEVVNMLEKENK